MCHQKASLCGLFAWARGLSMFFFSWESGLSSFVVTKTRGSIFLYFESHGVSSEGLRICFFFLENQDYQVLLLQKQGEVSFYILNPMVCHQRGFVYVFFFLRIRIIKFCCYKNKGKYLFIFWIPWCVIRGASYMVFLYFFFSWASGLSSFVVTKTRGSIFLYFESLGVSSEGLRICFFFLENQDYQVLLLQKQGEVSHGVSSEGLRIWSFFFLRIRIIKFCCYKNKGKYLFIFWIPWCVIRGVFFFSWESGIFLYFESLGVSSEGLRICFFSWESGLSSFVVTKTRGSIFLYFESLGVSSEGLRIWSFFFLENQDYQVLLLQKQGEVPFYILNPLVCHQRGSSYDQREVPFFFTLVRGLSRFFVRKTRISMIFVAASHQTGLDTRSKAQRPIKVGIKGRERSGTSRDSNPPGLCYSLTH